MLEGRNIAFISDYGIALDMESRAERAFDIHGGIVLMVMGDAEIYGSHNISLSNTSETPDRGAFIADILSLPLGLEVERLDDVNAYTHYQREVDKQRLREMLNISKRKALLHHELCRYPTAYAKGALANFRGAGDCHKPSTAADLVRAVQTSRHTYIKIPASLIDPEQQSAHMSFLRRLVQYQLANLAKIFYSGQRNNSRCGGLAYDKALAPLMDFIERYDLEMNMPKGHEIFYSRYDMTDEEYEEHLAACKVILDTPAADVVLETAEAQSELDAKDDVVEKGAGDVE